MQGLLPDVVKVFNKQIDYLRQSSITFDQETRVSVYDYGSDVNCRIFDVDVARPMTLTKIQSSGMTALMDAVGQAVEDFELLPEKYGDHSFMVCLITDGMENRSRNYNISQFQSLLQRKSNNVTFTAFAPSINSVQQLKQLGFEPGNVEKWDTTRAGIEEVGKKFGQTMDNYFHLRSTGEKVSTTMFSDLNKATVKDVKKVAKELKKSEYDIVINKATQAVQIRDLVEGDLGVTYRKGSAFYELVKNEHIQESKEIAVQNKKSGKIYKGYGARQMLGLPDRGKVKVDVKDTNNKKWVIYVQSGSVNRNVIPKQKVLVIN